MESKVVAKALLKCKTLPEMIACQSTLITMYSSNQLTEEEFTTYYKLFSIAMVELRKEN